MGEDGPSGGFSRYITTSGGGGLGGRYVFASLAELDEIIVEWTSIRDDLAAAGEGLRQALMMDLTPADDDMSGGQASALYTSLLGAADHNDSMASYMNSYIDKITAARAEYAATDQQAVERLGRAQ